LTNARRFEITNPSNGANFLRRRPVNTPSPKRNKKSVWNRLGRHVRDIFIEAFPLEVYSRSQLTLRLRNRSEISVYLSIFIDQLYPFDRFKSFVRSADRPVIFDVGANTGLFAAAAFDHWPQARVHSFEPQRKLIPRMQEMAALNRLEDRYTVNWCAIGDHCGSAEFYENRNPISASLIKEKVAKRSIRRVEQVPLTTLDEYARAHGIPQVNILKLDVEGVEIAALSGAAKTLATAELVFVEVHPPYSTFAEAKKLLNAAGLECMTHEVAPNETSQFDSVFVRR
jgi:FkbM family methyltransferase